jgi:serine/threonine-protein kinase
MNTCPKCGAEFPGTVRICPHDGTVLEEQSAGDARLGTTLDGKYRLESALGQGGMGTIYRATHLMLDKPVALKLIKADLVTSPDVVRRFQREARAASNLNHPHIAAAYDLGQTPDGTLYIAMELVNGPSLKDVIRSTGPLDAARIGRILRQVASALSVAHKHGIIHRDLKPHNIMLATAPGEAEVAKLLDFGIAKTFDDAATQLTATGFVLGTPQYMSPEQAAGRPIDGRSDLYSLGIILFEMLVGEVPFNDPSTPAVLVKHLTEPAPAPSLRRPDLQIPPGLEAIALRCLEKDPAARYQTADEFALALAQALGDPGPAVLPTELAPTVVMTPPGAPTAAAPLPPTMITPPAAAASPGQKTGQVFSPVAPVAPTVAATAAGPVPVAPTIAATAAGHAPVAPTVAATAASAPTPSTAAASSSPAASPLSRNVLIVGAAIVLLLVGGAYVTMSGMLGGGASSAPPDAPLAAADNPPPATPPAPSGGGSEPTGGGSDTTAAGQGAGTASPPAPPSNVPPPASGGQSSGTRAGGGAAAGGAAGTSAPPAVVTPPAPTGVSPQRTGEPPAGAPAQAANPNVAFRCSGASNVCASLRGAISPAFDAQSIVSVQDPGKADILVEARVEVVSERTEQMFGTTFVTRTYSVELTGETRGSSQAVPMPAPRTFSFDARVGQERLDGQMRLIAASAAERLRAFWKGR